MREFSGLTQQVVDQPDLRVFVTQCRAGSRISDHRHEHAFLSFLIDGDYQEGTGAGMQSCRANDLTWHPPGDRHEVHHGPGDVVSLQFEFTRPEFERIALGKLPRSRSTRFFPHVRSLIAEVRAESGRQDSYSDAAIRGRLLQLMAMLGREFESGQDAGPKAIAAVEQALDSGFPDRPDIGALADELGLTPARLSVLWQRHSGQSLSKTWQKHRLKRACRKLLEANLSIAEVALECGYYDQSHFTHSFSKAMKCTPGAFRRSRGSGA